MAVSIETLLSTFHSVWKPDQSNNALRPMADLWWQLGQFAASGVSFANFSPMPFVTHEHRFGIERVCCASNDDLDGWGQKLAAFDSAHGLRLRKACDSWTATSTADRLIGTAFSAWLDNVAVAACFHRPSTVGSGLSKHDSGARAAFYAAIGNQPQPVLARHDRLKVALGLCFDLMHGLTAKVLAVEEAGGAFFKQAVDAPNGHVKAGDRAGSDDDSDTDCDHQSDCDDNDCLDGDEAHWQSQHALDASFAEWQEMSKKVLGAGNGAEFASTVHRTLKRNRSPAPAANAAASHVL